MKKKNIYFLAIILIVLIAFVFFFFPQKPAYAFFYEKENVLLASDENAPKVLMEEMLSKKTFIVSVKVNPDEDIALSANNFLIPFIGVLNGNDKNAVLLIQEFDAVGKLLSCETNFGDVQTQEKISAEECTALLNEDSAVKLLLNSQNDSLQKPEIVFFKNKIEITPKDDSSLNNVSRVLLSEMFPNYDEIIKKANFISSLIVK